MAVISSYSTLVTEVGSWLARSDLTAAIPGFIQSFEERFLSDPENHAVWMESALSVTLSSSVAALPTDYLGLRVAYFSGYPPLKRLLVVVGLPALQTSLRVIARSSSSVLKLRAALY
jgi:hypothetical protein